MEKIGLLAGLGRLPVEFARAAGKFGYSVAAVSLLADTDEELAAVCDDYAAISVGRLDSIIKFLKDSGVTKVTFLGKVSKEVMFAGLIQGDERMLKLLMSLPDKNDDTIMMAFVKELADEGINVFDQTVFIQSLMVTAGVHTKLQPSAEQRGDMEYGFKMAKHIGGLDIGQTVVVKNKAVLAVEAIEGTDECILRGGRLGRGGVIVAKVAKPEQDLRFDMPTVGIKTLESMIEAGAKGLVLEAGKTLLVDREKTLELADANGIAIMAM